MYQTWKSNIKTGRDDIKTLQTYFNAWLCYGKPQSQSQGKCYLDFINHSCAVTFMNALWGKNQSALLISFPASTHHKCQIMYEWSVCGLAQNGCLLVFDMWSSMGPISIPADIRLLVDDLRHGAHIQVNDEHCRHQEKHIDHRHNIILVKVTQANLSKWHFH